MSLWDLRASEQGGLVTRVNVAPGGSALYALAWAHGALAVAGEERALVVLEPRKWGHLMALDLSSACCRYALSQPSGACPSATVLHVRRWRVLHKWGGATKYSLTYLALSHCAPAWAYVSVKRQP